MKSIQDLIREKELELQQALESAVHAKELELVQLRKTLREALRTIDRLLEEEADGAGSKPMGSPESFMGAREAARAVKSVGNGGSELP